MKDLVILFSNNIFIEILMLAICADMLLGVLRAIKFRQFNSSVALMVPSEKWRWLSVWGF